MELFRIAKPQHIRDLAGTGAQKNGGRWNNVGTTMLYTASSISLATLEMLAHYDITAPPKNLALMTLHIPESVYFEELDVTELPDNWDAGVAPFILSEFGDAWIRNESSLLLKVPSAVNPYESNFLVNPNHQDHSSIEIVRVVPFSPDQRITNKFGTS